MMIFASKSWFTKGEILRSIRLLSFVAILICSNLFALAQTGSNPVDVTIHMSSTSFLYRDGAGVDINVSCNTNCGNVDIWIDNYWWGSSTLDTSGNANGANTIYVPQSVLTPGLHHLTVNYQGNANFAPASKTQDFTILALGTTPTLTTASLSPPAFSAAVGAWVNIHVNCTSPCGNVDIKIDDTYDWGTVPLDPNGYNNGGNTTYIPITYQNPGPHHLTVYYLGNTTYAPSNSGQVNFTILGPTSAGLIYGFNISSFQPNGNVAAYTDSVNGDWSNINHDALNRLTAATQSINKSGQNFCWTYDSFGNRTSQTISTAECNVPSPPPPTVAWTYNSSNQVTSMCDVDPSTGSCFPSEIISIASDANGGGNTTAVGANQYLFDAENRLCAVQYPAIVGGPAAMVQYIYDAEGNRVAKGTITSWSCDASSNGFSETNGYMIGPDGEQLTEVNGQGNWVHTNVFASGQLIATYDPQNIHFHFSDWLGTRRVQTDYAGNIESTYQNLPFGELVPQNLSPGSTEHLFTGLERDQESGLDHAQFRQYSSTMGRWMAPDPYLGSMDLGNPQSFNRYAYVGNTPLMYTDPSGENPCAGLAVAGAAFGPVGEGVGIGVCVGSILDGLLHVLNLFEKPKFHGSLTPRPNAQPWDEYHIHYGANIPGALGLPGYGGCEFGTCGAGPSAFGSGPSISGIKNYWAEIQEHVAKIAENPDSWDVPKWRTEIKAFRKGIIKEASKRQGDVSKYLERIIGISLDDLNNINPELLFIVSPQELCRTMPDPQRRTNPLCAPYLGGG